LYDPLPFLIFSFFGKKALDVTNAANALCLIFPLSCWNDILILSIFENPKRLNGVYFKRISFSIPALNY